MKLVVSLKLTYYWILVFTCYFSHFDSMLAWKVLYRSNHNSFLWLLWKDKTNTSKTNTQLTLHPQQTRQSDDKFSLASLCWFHSPYRCYQWFLYRSKKKGKIMSEVPWIYKHPSITISPWILQRSEFLSLFNNTTIYLLNILHVND